MQEFDRGNNFLLKKKKVKIQDRINKYIFCLRFIKLFRITLPKLCPLFKIYQIIQNYTTETVSTDTLTAMTNI